MKRKRPTPPIADRLPAVDLLAVRSRLGPHCPVTQDEFARRFGFSAATVRDWEQGRRKPDAAARTLLALIAHDPVLVEATLKAAAMRTIWTPEEEVQSL